MLLLLFITGISRLQAQTHSSEAGLTTENDSYLGKGSDRYYTNGIFLYYRHALPVTITDSTRLQNKVLGFEAGQKMFNPQAANVPSAAYIDRPFAAYLYIGSTLNLLYKDESSLKLGAQVGVVGPDALGKETQDLIHKTFGFYHPDGWRYQIRNDAELNLSAAYNRLLLRVSAVDLSLASYANLGNGFTGAGLGPVIRLGLFNQLFNSVTTQSTAIQRGNSAPLHRYELFAYFKPMLNYVAYDATVQGSLFRTHPAGPDEITLNPERFVYSQQWGIAYAGKRLVLDAAAVYHTKDVKEMFRKHQWGSVTVLYRFH